MWNGEILKKDSMIFYYSGCGNSKFVAETLSKYQNDKMIFIPEAHRNKTYSYSVGEEESVGFVFPVYAWAPPSIVLDFIQNLHFETPVSYLYMVVTCGDNVGMTERIFRKALEKKALQLNASFCVVMPNTYMIMRGMNLDNPKLAQQKITDAQRLLPEIAQQIARKENVQNKLPKGAFPLLKSYPIRYGFCKSMTDKPFHATEHCVSCGKCATVCPLQNITLLSGKPQWNGQCTNCLACYHHCPQNAIQYGNISIGKGQYFFGKKLS